MQIQPSLWLKLRRICVDHLATDSALLSEITELADRLPACLPREQHPLIANLLSKLAGSPAAVEHALLIGTRLPVTAYGVPSLGILTAPNVGDAMRFIADIHDLLVPLIDLAYEEDRTEGRLTIGFRHPVDSEGEALAVAACTAALVSTVFHHAGRIGTISRIELTPSSKGAEEVYRKHLSVTPHTDAKANTLIISRAALDRPNMHADPDTFNLVIRACHARAEGQACRAQLQARVLEIVTSRIGSRLSQERVARMLDLTPRQLRQHLEREGTSFQRIVRRGRTEYATALLQNPSLSLSQVADRLGYSELSAFSHAFQRWTGRCPSAFRCDIQLRSQAA